MLTQTTLALITIMMSSGPSHHLNHHHPALSNTPGHEASLLANPDGTYDISYWIFDGTNMPKYSVLTAESLIAYCHDNPNKCNLYRRPPQQSQN